EFTVLVGPSGCGKSTLLRMLAGLEEISGGEISIDGQVVNDVASKDRDIAMVFQSYALYPHMTVAQNLAFGLKLRKHGKAMVAARVDAAARTLGLTGMLDKLPRELSGGQRQRVALGRALVREPSVFLLDEPLSNLDAKLRHSVRTEIARLHRKLGATMVYVTHDQVEAMTLGQRIVVLKDGEIQQIDTPMALYERPANLFVAGFLGSPAMNVVEGTLSASLDALALDDGATLPLGTAPRAGLGEWAGRRVAVGVRPEDLHLAADEAMGAFDATLEGIEPIGNEIFLDLRHGPRELVARVAPRALPAVGSVQGLVLASERLHFFDAGSGLRIDARG
ncbi:MAG TPA: ATP-binding cassette domain-containing protein, partial [Pseudoxanthomonas sp.]|nr:ATP-binding cassette domain-containing protein [Pseudoxanthomonas sp.]